MNTNGQLETCSVRESIIVIHIAIERTKFARFNRIAFDL